MMHIFDTFTEAQAKLLPKSFIGELGRKYTQTEHGFTCGDVDTAQCIGNPRLLKAEAFSLTDVTLSKTAVKYIMNILHQCQSQKCALGA